MTRALFPRAARLLKRTQFLFTQAEGKRYAGRYVVLYVYEAAKSSGLRVGLTVSKRVSHLAHERNLLRRRLRHLGRELRSLTLKEADIVLIAKPTSLKASFKELADDAGCLFKKAGLLKSSG